MSPTVIFSIGTFLSFPLILGSVLFARRQLNQYIFGKSEISFLGLMRRLLAAGLTITISVMLFHGSNFMNMPTHPVEFINFWLMWLILVFILLIILMWDWIVTHKMYRKKQKQFRDELIQNSLGEGFTKIEISGDNAIYISNEEEEE